MFQTTLPLPFQILFASLTLLAGLVVAKIVESGTIKFLKKIKLELVLKRMGGEEILSKFWEGFDALKFFSQLVKWFFIILFLMMAFDILGLEKAASFLEAILKYYPNIFIAVLIFLITVYLLDFSKKVFIGTFEKEKLSFSPLLGRGFSFFVWTLAIFAILYQLKIVPELILVLFVGIVIVFSLAVGISLGIGGKDLANKFLKELEEKMKK